MSHTQRQVDVPELVVFLGELLDQLSLPVLRLQLVRHLRLLSSLGNKTVHMHSHLGYEQGIRSSRPLFVHFMILAATFIAFRRRFY